MVCPASLVAQWEQEVRKRVKKGILSVCLHHGNRREDRAKRLARFDIVITTYQILARELDRSGVCFNVSNEKIGKFLVFYN